jgi:hypothetical protein
VNVSVLQLRRPYEFISPFGGAAFAALLLVLDPAVTKEEQTALSEQLVAQACRYAVCAGFDCSSWDDAIDWASVMTEVEERPSHGFVMTTWHTDEPLEEVVAFFRNCVSVDDQPPAHRVAILVGEDEARQRALLQHLEAQ